jgi:tetratricopeptide (TPR) repeat protein
VLEKRPDDQALIGNLSAVEKSVGEFMFYMHRYPEAGEAMRHALALDEQRLANAPYHARIRADVAISLNILSRLAMSQDDVAGAVALRERALAIRRQLAAADPQNVELQERLAVSLSLLAESYNQQTRHREAGAHAAEAVRLLQGLAGTTKPPLLTRRLWAASMELAIADLRQGHLSSACATHARATALVETLRRAKSVDQSYQEQVHHWAREFAPHCGNTAE